MDNRIMKLIIALGKFSAQPRQYRIIEGLNASETGVFWAMTQIVAEKPDTELFGLSELNSYLNFTRPNLSRLSISLRTRAMLRGSYLRMTEE
ncbi:transcriptional regulator MarR family [[Eubacterium] siraeum CAG:80]|uniref:Transcriptional regulator MarR family n=1 Tax=[Eubacterium] siraeum CAG:80 TaxID=1263080 RepID=R6SRG5_9FIRM|nr:transcriptional regulator MarR family [[Eubacterium] siraeum CAG:80]